MALTDFLNRPIAFHRVYVTLTGSITSALMLSQSVYWQTVVNNGRGGKDGWWFKTQQEWTEETGLTRHELETARKKIKSLGLVKTKKAGLPAKVWYRVNFNLLEEKLQEIQQIATNQQTWLPDADKIVGEDTAKKDAEISHNNNTENTTQIYSKNTTTVAVVSENEINILLNKIPEHHRHKSSLLKLISDFVFQKGIKYVDRNIRYVNSRNPNKNYKNYFAQALKEDWGAEYDSDLKREAEYNQKMEHLNIESEKTEMERIEKQRNENDSLNQMVENLTAAQKCIFDEFVAQKVDEEANKFDKKRFKQFQTAQGDISDQFIERIHRQYIEEFLNSFQLSAESI